MLLAVLLVACAFEGCVGMRAEAGLKSVRSFVADHEDELNGMIAELGQRYADELHSGVVTVISEENLKADCPKLGTFFREYAKEGYNTVSLTGNGCVEVIKSGATGSMWAYVGFYYSPTGEPHVFHDGELTRIDMTRWEETKANSDNFSESELVCPNWFVFTLGF